MNRLFLASALLLTLLAPGCGLSRGAEEDDEAFVGRIYAVGNEPFVHPGLDVQGTMYELRGTKEVQRDLLGHQGKRARVHASRIDDRGPGKALDVLRVEYLAD